MRREEHKEITTPGNNRYRQFIIKADLILFVDVADDLARGAFLFVPGLLVFAVVFLLGAWRLFGQAIWRIVRRR